MGVAVFAVISILILFGLPILITFIVSQIALSIKTKKEEKERLDRDKTNEKK